MTDWTKICTLEDIPLQGSRTLESGKGRIALFRAHDGTVYALKDHCPHRGGQLAQGMVCGRHVTCPMHGWNIGLADGVAVAPDRGATPTFPVKIEDGLVFVKIGDE
ncbi:MAG: nitrite reductase small subunit NirD [Sulfuricellaceae bacterium]